MRTSLATQLHLDPKEVADFLAAAERLAHLLVGSFKPLQRTDTKRMTRPRANSSEVVKDLAVLAKRYAIESPSNPIEPALENQALVDTLRPVMERVDAISKVLGDIAFAASSEAWRSALITYGLLKVESRSNATLAAGLQPIVDGMRPTYVTEDGGLTHKRSRRAPGSPSKHRKKAPAGGGTAGSTPPGVVRPGGVNGVGEPWR